MKSPVRIFLIFLLAIASLESYAQTPKKKTKIEILSADTWEFDSRVAGNADRLIGNVRFKHENAIMSCDSAYLFKAINSIRAWGDIYINESDSVHINGDSLHYDGNSRIAELFGNVKLRDPGMSVTAPYLKYDMTSKRASYSGGGILVNSKNNNTLTSGIGVYHSKSRDFFFRDSVVLVSPDYTIYSDTLKYNTLSEITWFFGPTLIVSKENTIYCENGWYDTRNGLAVFKKNAWMESEGQRMSGDSLFYDRNTGEGSAIGNVAVVDTVENMIINGKQAYFYEAKDSSLITGNAMLTMIFDNDSLFLHGDTLIAINDTVSGHRTMRAYHHVQFFKSDMQGSCDSLTYSGVDSLLHMYTRPVLWADGNQMTAQKISMRIFEGKIESMDLENTAFIISQDDTLFNQIKGKSMKGWFDDNALRRVDVFGNGQTLYFARKDSGGFFGMNTASSSDLRIYIEEKEIQEIIFLNQPEGVLTPLNQTYPDERRLSDFKWLEFLRPKSREDIFIIKQEEQGLPEPEVMRSDQQN